MFYWVNTYNVPRVANQLPACLQKMYTLMELTTKSTMPLRWYKLEQDTTMNLIRYFNPFLVTSHPALRVAEMVEPIPATSGRRWVILVFFCFFFHFCYCSQSKSGTTQTEWTGDKDLLSEIFDFYWVWQIVVLFLLIWEASIHPAYPRYLRAKAVHPGQVASLWLTKREHFRGSVQNTRPHTCCL